MNPPPDPSDPLLQCLADLAAPLPATAAREAQRARAQRTRHRRQSAAALVLIAYAIGAWQMRPAPKPQPPQPEIAQRAEAPAAPDSPAQYVKVQTVQEAMAEPLPLPTGLDKEQTALLDAARGLPLLLVKDASGKVTRIHVIER